ncbi:sensor histidine kinase [Brucellaceae bacterium C25G]
MSNTSPQYIRNKEYSIQRRIIIGGGLTLLAVTVALFFLGRLYAQRAADEAFDRVLGAAALSIADTITLQDGALSVDLPHSAFAILGTSRLNRIFYRVVTPDGNLLTGSPILGLEIPHGSSNHLRLSDSVYRGENIRIAAVARYHSDAEGGGWVDVLVGETREARDQLTLQLSLNTILPVLGVAVLALALIWLAIRLAFRPLQIVEANLRLRASADLNPVTGAIPKEVSALVTALNDFMVRLNSLLDGLKLVTADAAHQMRTPLTALRALTELSLEETDAKKRQEILTRIHANSISASLLANQLLSEATTLHSIQSRNLELLDLLQVVQEAIRRLRAEGNYQKLHKLIKLDAPQKAYYLYAEPISLREMIRNIIENALVHAPGPIDITLREDNLQIIFGVHDRGSGFSQQMKEKAFDRFVRADQSKPGSGLGLSIAKMVAEALGGQIDIKDRKGGGTSILVKLPSAHQGAD